MKDYYQILGVNKNASQDEIKKAYRKLSKQFHPDVNPEGADMFKEVAEAYDTLSDENKRKQYDNPNPFGSGNPFDMFNDMMNQQRRPRPPKVKDKVIKVTITPEESYHGVEKELTYKAKHSCETCVGTGGKKRVCSTCNGVGALQQKIGTGFFTQIVETPCPSCGGKGQMVVDPCVSCNGIGSIEKFNNLRIKLSKSVDSGDFLRVGKKGDFINGIQGDLLLQINLTKNNYEKLGKDLVTYINLSPVDMIVNKTHIVNHPTGNLQINLPEGLNTEKPLRIKHKGYITPNGVGDFFIKLNVSKQQITEEDKEKLKSYLEQVD